MFRAATEVHVFLVIAVSLAIRSDLSREFVSETYYDWGLFISFVVLVPVAFVCAVVAKIRAAGKSLYENTLEGRIERIRYGLATDEDRVVLGQHVEAIRATVRVSSDILRRVVVSCPELTTLDPDGRGPYDQLAMDKCLHLQEQGIVKLAFDRAGTSTARQEDVPLFEAGGEKIKETMWFYGYATAVKRCVSLEMQNFR
eukprot:COSAG02_NODE_6232_length_3710_cov_3.154528_4_plen_198_part_01